MEQPCTRDGQPDQTPDFRNVSSAQNIRDCQTIQTQDIENVDRFT